HGRVDARMEAAHLAFGTGERFHLQDLRWAVLRPHDLVLARPLEPNRAPDRLGDDRRLDVHFLVVVVAPTVEAAAGAALDLDLLLAVEAERLRDHPPGAERPLTGRPHHRAVFGHVGEGERRGDGSVIKVGTTIDTGNGVDAVT